MKFDVHNHAMPERCLWHLQQEGHRYDVAIEEGNPPILRHGKGYVYPVDPSFYDAVHKLEQLRSKGLDSALLSLAPSLLFYEMESGAARRFLRMANEGLSEMVKQHANTFRFAASLPLQDVPAALDELETACRLPGMAAVMIGASVNEAPLDDPRFDDLWMACAGYRKPVVIHPSYIGARDELADYYLTNVVGNPLQTTIAAMRLASAGILDRHPDLSVILVHGGGCLPYLMGRLAHARAVRPELERAPGHLDQYGRRFYYDTLVYTPGALRFLIDLVGADRVMLGSDAPFDMAEDDPLGVLRRALEDSDTDTLATILEATPGRLFNLG